MNRRKQHDPGLRHQSSLDGQQGVSHDMHTAPGDLSNMPHHSTLYTCVWMGNQSTLLLQQFKQITSLWHQLIYIKSLKIVLDTRPESYGVEMFGPSCFRLIAEAAAAAVKSDASLGGFASASGGAWCGDPFGCRISTGLTFAARAGLHVRCAGRQNMLYGLLT